MNKVSLIGNLTKEVEFGGTEELSFCKSSLAVRSGNNTEFIPFTAFGKVAEILRDYTAKGSKVALNGYLKHESWEKDGKKNYALKFVTNEVELLSKADKNEELKELPAEEQDGLPF